MAAFRVTSSLPLVFSLVTVKSISAGIEFPSTMAGVPEIVPPASITRNETPSKSVDDRTPPLVSASTSMRETFCILPVTASTSLVDALFGDRSTDSFPWAAGD